MIKAINKDGSQKRELLINEEFLMVDKYDSLSFETENEKFGMKLTFNFKFSDSGKKYSADGSMSDEGDIIDFTLNNWYSSSRVENTKALELDLKSGKKIWVKYGTSANEKRSFRMFHLTIWGELKDE